MANQKLDEVMELLNKVRERQDKYEKDYFKKDHDTASCNCFAGEKEKNGTASRTYEIINYY